MFPSSIREINELPENEKNAIYATLLPDWFYDQYSIDRETFASNGRKVVQFRSPPGSRAVEIIGKRDPADIDPVVYLNMADTFNHKLLVLLVVVNDLGGERYNTDFDEHGNRTHFGTASRNIYAEEEAMKAGLAPGQVRAGRRAFKQTVPIFEEFVKNMGHELFLIEPLAYHNAIIFERYGFNYIQGRNEMIRINDEFQINGNLHQKLTPNNPFRPLDAWQTIRGRSWAIHDGILGHPFTGFQMYKRIGIHAGVNTFPNAQW